MKYPAVPRDRDSQGPQAPERKQDYQSRGLADLVLSHIGACLTLVKKRNVVILDEDECHDRLARAIQP